MRDLDIFAEPVLNSTEGCCETPAAKDLLIELVDAASIGDEY